jgi:hypothetical protein
MTITEFLLARIAEDEAVAKAATTGPWRWCDDPEEGMESETATMVNGQYPQRVIWANGMHTEGFVNTEEPDRGHIARWNPARVLAECGAKRRIVEANDMRQAKADSPEHGWWGNGLETGMTVGRRRLSPSEAETFMEEWYEPAPPNTTLRALASVYADHPDYREEWRP